MRNLEDAQDRTGWEDTQFFILYENGKEIFNALEEDITLREYFEKENKSNLFVKDTFRSNEENEKLNSLLQNSKDYSDYLKNSQEQNTTIEITKTNFNLHPDYAKLFETGKEFGGEDAKALLQLLSRADDAIKDDNAKNLKLSNDSIELKFNTSNGPMVCNFSIGDGIFAKDVNKILDLTNSDLDRLETPQNTKKLLGDALEKETVVEKIGNTSQEKSVFKNPVSQQSVENVLNASIESISTMSQTLGDESVGAFVSSLSQTYKAAIGINPLGSKSNNLEENLTKFAQQSQNQTEQINSTLSRMQNMQSNLVKTIDSNLEKLNAELKKDKERERVRNKDKNLDR